MQHTPVSGSLGVIVLLGVAVEVLLCAEA